MLTEKEKMQRAKMYMLKLADGINPVNDTKPENDTILADERLSRCFSYVADVLDTAISAGSSVKHSTKGKKTDFTITEKQLENVAVFNKDITISELAAEINRVTDNPDMKKLQPKIINDWLVKQEYLKNEIDYAGNNHRNITEKSAEIGITSKKAIGNFGEYTAILYSETAQKFIIDNMFHILENAKNEKERN